MLLAGCEVAALLPEQRPGAGRSGIMGHMNTRTSAAPRRTLQQLSDDILAARAAAATQRASTFNSAL